MSDLHGGAVDSLPLSPNVPVHEADPTIRVTHEDGVENSVPKPLQSLRKPDLVDNAAVSDDSESDSLYEDILDSLGDGSVIHAGPDVCTSEEAASLQALLRRVGEDRFIEETLEAKLYTAKKLCTAFGIFPPEFLEGSPDNAYYPLLSVALQRELHRRRKLPQFNTIEDAAELLKQAKNVIVLTGAGISTSLGIPDFRSKDTGLYARLEHLGLSDPQEVFDISIFREDPAIFYSIAKDIVPATHRYSPTHAFIRLLQDQGKLLTNFTQNIDNLEHHAGVSADKLVQCHGSFATATCQKCFARVSGEEILPDLKAGHVPRCKTCAARLQRLGAVGMKRRRSAHNGQARRRKNGEDESDESDEYEQEAIGVMKPDITFFGEDLPATFRRRLIDHDRELVDLVLVIGTSLKVAPVSSVPTIIPPEVPQIYISRDACKHIEFDITLLGECDEIVADLCQRVGWNLHSKSSADASTQRTP